MGRRMLLKNDNRVERARGWMACACDICSTSSLYHFHLPPDGGGGIAVSNCLLFPGMSFWIVSLNSIIPATQQSFAPFIPPLHSSLPFRMTVCRNILIAKLTRDGDWGRLLLTYCAKGTITGIQAENETFPLSVTISFGNIDSLLLSSRCCCWKSSKDISHNREHPSLYPIYFPTNLQTLKRAFRGIKDTTLRSDAMIPFKVV